MASWRLWMAVVGGGAVAALSGPWVVAKLQNPPRTLDAIAGAIPRLPAVEQADFLLLVGRRPERQHAEDPVPHRNSRVALYERGSDGEFRRATETLSVRSTSTAEFPHPDEPGRAFGYVAVPLGFFSMEQMPWRDGETPAFRLSDWGGFDGVIMLQETQVIARGDPPEVERSGTEKTGSWIHPSITTIWSHGDSRGCLNLFLPQKDFREGAEGERFEYDAFLGWFSERGLTPGPKGRPVVAAVAPFAWVAGEGEDDLVEVLPEDFFARLRARQGEQMAADD